MRLDYGIIYDRRIRSNNATNRDLLHCNIIASVRRATSGCAAFLCVLKPSKAHCKKVHIFAMGFWHGKKTAPNLLRKVMMWPEHSYKIIL